MPVPADYQEFVSSSFDVRVCEALWSFHASSGGSHLVLPDGRMDLVARYRVGSRGRVHDVTLTVAGPSERPMWVPVEIGDRFLGVRFRAGWGGAALGVDPAELRDASLSGEESLSVLGPEASRLTSSGTEAELRTAVLKLSRRLIDQADRASVPSSVVAAIDLLHLAGGRLSLPDLARASGASERTLRRHFGSTVGLSVKSLASVVRFQRTMRLLAHASPGALSLIQAALEGGYSDQAHMTRDFLRYGGFTPGRRPSVAFGSLPIAGVAEFFKNGNARSK